MLGLAVSWNPVVYITCFCPVNQLNYRKNHITVINTSTVHTYLAYDNNCKDYKNIVLENILERDCKEWLLIQFYIGVLTASYI